MTAREIVRVLEHHGFEPVRQSGSHLILRHADGRRVTVPIHRARISAADF
jgi:predicted RNA binding protein YcfA (HicA-like mRNA interferase family)